VKNLNRRSFLMTAAGATAGLATVSAHPRINSKVRGVQIGAQSYSFRSLDTEGMIAAYQECGIGSAEIYSGHLEANIPISDPTPRTLPDGRQVPARPSREDQRKWRLSVDLAEFETVGRKLHENGVEVYAYNYSFREDFDDAEIERGFEMAQAIGARYITASSNVTTAKKIDPFAKRYQMRVGMHNHSRIDDNEFATPESFERARMGTSDFIAVNLDIGHFVAANFEPLEYIRKNYADILTLHIKDRKKDQGDNTVFGEGDTPIVEVLQLVREEGYQFPCNIEYEYRGEGDAVTEVKKCLSYCRQALET
jgi:sugar phosphate isomerase/epimerase